jgi:hypothetical protein
MGASPQSLRPIRVDWVKGEPQPIHLKPLRFERLSAALFYSQTKPKPWRDTRALIIKAATIYPT